MSVHFAPPLPPLSDRACSGVTYFLPCEKMKPMINSRRLNTKGRPLLQVRHCLISVLSDVTSTFSPHSTYKINNSTLVF